MGRHFVAQTDHKPLLSVMKKPLPDLSPKLCCMVSKLQMYSFDLQYLPGKNNVLADILSRDVATKETVDTSDIETQSLICAINVVVTTDRLEELRLASENDQTHQAIRSCINSGWPCHKSQLKNFSVRPYWDCRHELHEWNRLLCRGQRLVIPASENKTNTYCATSTLGIWACRNVNCVRRNPYIGPEWGTK